MNPGEVGRVLLSSYMLGYKPEVMEAARRHVVGAPVAFPAAEATKSKRKKKRNGKKPSPPPREENDDAPKEQDELKSAIKREMDKFLSLAGNNHLQAELNHLKKVNARLTLGDVVVVKPRWKTPKESGYTSDDNSCYSSTSTTYSDHHDQHAIVMEHARRTLIQAAKLI